MLSEFKSSLCNLDRASELDDLHELMSASQAWTTSVKEKLDEGSTVEELKQLADDGAMLRIEVPQVAMIQSRYEDALKWVDETQDALANTDIGQYEKWLDSARRISLQHDRVEMIAHRVESAQNWRQSACSLFCKSAESLADALGLQYLVHEHLKRLANRSCDATTCLCQDEKPGWMVQCDFCDAWYHGRCIYITKSSVSTNSQFMCPVCCKRKGVPYPFDKKSTKERPALDDVLAVLKEGSELQTKVSEFALIKSIAEEVAQWKTRAAAALADCPMVELNFEAVRRKQPVQSPRPNGDAMDIDIAAETVAIGDKKDVVADRASGDTCSGGPEPAPHDDDCVRQSLRGGMTIDSMLCDEEEAIPTSDSPAKDMRLAEEELAEWVRHETKISALLLESQGSDDSRHCCPPFT